MDKFKLVSKFKPTGDQPQAINALVSGILNGENEPIESANHPMMTIKIPFEREIRIGSMLRMDMTKV